MVKQQLGSPASGVDMALWLDEVESSLGNPLLVEVKLGRLTESKIAQAEDQLRSYIVKTHARAGLLVYLDRQGHRFDQRGQPIVLGSDQVVAKRPGAVFELAGDDGAASPLLP